MVNPVMNMVTDKEKNQESRIEPRLISLLCLLSENARQLVYRETLIKEIWNDYGGADEGLNQGISFLRKLLNDNDKKLIETVPKKGYVLNASVTPDAITTPAENGKSPGQKERPQRRYLIPLLVSVAAILIWIIFRSKQYDSASPDILNKGQIEDSAAYRNAPFGSDINPDLQKKPDSSSLRDTQH